MRGCAVRSRAIEADRATERPRNRGVTMTVVETIATALTDQQLALLFQYTVEAYKTFEKLAENLPNPMTATVFKQFAVDERNNRDLIEMKMLAAGRGRVRVTLAADMIFDNILEGELSYREAAEFL